LDKPSATRLNRLADATVDWKELKLEYFATSGAHVQSAGAADGLASKPGLDTNGAAIKKRPTGRFAFH
jgi:hypothetical protein